MRTPPGGLRAALIAVAAALLLAGPAAAGTANHRLGVPDLHPAPAAPT
jgi:hypothetical protein